MTVGEASPGVSTQGTGPVRVGWPRVVVLACVLLLVAVLYAVGVLLPYFVNDLDRLSLAEVASGAHDPKDLWPQNAWAGPVQVAGLVSVTFGVLVAVASAALSVLALLVVWRDGEPARLPKTVALVLLVGASLSALGYLLSDTGSALQTWRLD